MFQIFSLSLFIMSCCIQFVKNNTCEERLQKYTNSCDINNQTVLRDGNFWVRYDNKLNRLILHPFDYCQTNLINFTLNDTKQQRRYNQMGLLCVACQHVLSLALGSSWCLPCSNSYLFLLPFAVMGLVLVLLIIFTCRLTVVVGTINGLIFYANIVGANQNTFYNNHLFNCANKLMIIVNIFNWVV